MRIKMVMIAWCLLSLTTTAEAARVALVIGNAAYPPKQANVNRFGSLSQASVNDAQDMAAALDAYEFKVTLLINATYGQMETALNVFAGQLGPGSVGLFYYAGHGIQVQKENYLLPVGKNFFDEADIIDGAYKANRALLKMESAQAQVKIMILDACRNDFEELRGSEERGLAQMAASGVIVSYAGSSGQSVNANPDEHGVYTRHLLAALRQSPQLPVEFLFKQVTNAVITETTKRGAPQRPWTAGNIFSDFCFDPQNRCAGFLPQVTAVPQVIYVEVTPRPEPTRKIATPVPLPAASGRLRSAPQTVSNNDEAMRLFDVVETKRSWGTAWAPRTYVNNKFERHGDVVLDHATGLTWQQSGSSKYLTYADAQQYISQINRESFGGYSDWRLPTVNELLSLMEQTQENGDLFINSVFDNRQRWCWSSDKRSSESAWDVRFNGGSVYWRYVGSSGYVRAVRP